MSTLPSPWNRVGYWVALACLGATWTACAKTDLGAGEEAGASPGQFETRPVEGDWQQTSVTAILQSHDGYLWLGTYHGLVRYDGVSFVVFDTGNTPQLANGRITSLYESPDHILWVGHETGQLTRLENGRLQTLDLGTNWPGGAVQNITTDQQGELWLLSDAGVLISARTGQRAKSPDDFARPTTTTLARTSRGKIWLAANGRMATLEGNNLVPARFPRDSAKEIYERVFPAADGGIWVLSGGVLRKWLEEHWAFRAEGFPRELGAVNTVAESRFGLLVGTEREGLFLIPPGAPPRHFSRVNGMSHDWIRALYVDREGNCWIGTGTGLDTLRQRKVRMLAPPDNWQGFAVLSFSVQPDNSAWIGTEGAGLYRYDGRHWTLFGEPDGLRNAYVWSVLQANPDTVYVGTWGRGLQRLRNDRLEAPGDLGKITAPVTALYQGRSGELWVGSQVGLHRFEADRLVWSAGKETLALPDVRAITEAADGTVWFGMSGGGLGRWRNGSLKQFRKSDGLGSDLVSCLCADPDGTLWIGTTDNGLTRMAHEQFSVISRDQGLPSRILCHVVDDGIGYLWLGSASGILRVSKADLHRCADSQSNTLRSLCFERPEGLTAPACSGAFQPGACRTPDGRLWFPTGKGLAIIDSANVTPNAVPPPVVIEALLLDGTATNWLSNPAAASALVLRPRTPSQSGSEILRIPPGHRRLEFHYTGLSFVAPNKVRFRRKLEGLEHAWVDAGTKRVAEYSYLPPGDYRFSVIACNNDELWNEQGATVSFTVLPFFWQTVWFRCFAIVLAAGAIAGTVLWIARRRLRARLEAMERQRAIERERARIARDIHDDLGASLTRVSLLSETIRSEISGPPEVVGGLEQIRHVARESTRAMDEIVWAVNPQYDTLDSLVAYLGRYAERFLVAAGIRCRLDVPVYLPPWGLNAEIRHNVFLTLKEALNNVAKHAHATEVRIAVELNDSGFTVLIKDNGRGFTVPATEDNPAVPAGNGLRNMRKRMAEIGSHCAWQSAPHEGTRIALTIVLHPTAPRSSGWIARWRKPSTVV